jgi:hypothetical protein
MHEDEEIRYILSGSCFFDVRGALKCFKRTLSTANEYTYAEHPSDKWIRVHVLPGDLIVILAGIYHRFSLDELNQVKGLRLFKVRKILLFVIPLKLSTRSGGTKVDPLCTQFRDRLQCPSHPVHKFTQCYYSMSVMSAVFTVVECFLL